MGADVDAEIRVGVFTLGGQIGYDDDTLFDGVPVHGTELGVTTSIGIAFGG